jgi:hypothetical protein
MKNTNIRKIIYHIRHRYLTLNNAVIVVAFLIAASWVWGSLGMMERNYTLQKDVDGKKRQLELAELQRDTLVFENQFVETSEYQELAVRESLGLVRPGERVLILPENTAKADAVDDVPTAPIEQASNLEQWVNFLFGGYSKSISGE